MMEQILLEQIVLGNSNKKKRRELETLFQPLGIRVVTLDAYADAVEIEEDGDSFAANAEAKAVRQARHLGQWVLGEDSGLCVDALKGEPGIYSARFAGENATDEDNNRLLLERLGGVPDERRGAHYVCHMALSDPAGHVRVRCEAYCEGWIRREGSGVGGFGYDPLFEIPEYHRTFGELGEAVKSVLSHRARAMRQFIPQLKALLCK